MPNNQPSENGLYDYEDTSYSEDDDVNEGYQFIDAPQQDDFSEYLWMENEEEFDKEVILHDPHFIYITLIETFSFYYFFSI